MHIAVFIALATSVVAVVKGGVVPGNATYQLQNVNTKYYMDQYRATPDQGDPVVSRVLEKIVRAQWATVVTTIDNSELVTFTTTGTVPASRVFVTGAEGDLLVTERLATLFNATKVTNVADPTYWLKLPYSTLALTGGPQGVDLSIEKFNATDTLQRWQFLPAA